MRPDHDHRMRRVDLALDGLSVGDALGEQYFRPENIDLLLRFERCPEGPWPYTDDTEMALAIAEVLEQRGAIDQDALALVFARRYTANVYRGYGSGAHQLLEALGGGADWRETAGALFDGTGSMGNGGAMRVAPVGAYFAEDDDDVIVQQARLSAEVTHQHPEGQAGAIAVAAATAWAWRCRAGGDDPEALEGLQAALFGFVLDLTPESETRNRIDRASRFDLSFAIPHATSVLGNGSQIIAQDTVPFSIWSIARHLGRFEEGILNTALGLGDRDTTCAIVGGPLALFGGPEGIPEAWRRAREPLDR